MQLINNINFSNLPKLLNYQKLAKVDKLNAKDKIKNINIKNVEL